MPGDLRYALRMLARERAFAAVVVLSLALGIGANTAIFSMVNGILLRPLAYREPERLFAIAEMVPMFSQRYPRVPVNLNHFLTWRERCRSFESMAASQPATFNLTGQDQPELLHGAAVTANMFETLGVRPQIGRSFHAEEELAGRDRVVMIADSLWRRRFNASPSIAGRKIMLDGEPYVVAGVAPRDFQFPRGRGLGSMSIASRVEVFKPLGYTAKEAQVALGNFNYKVFARLRPGVSRDQALSELNVVQSAISGTLPEKMELKGLMSPLLEEVVGDSRRGLLLIMAAVGAVLLVLCVNLANLSLARAAARARDFAVRTALGAGRTRLARLALLESLILSLAGGALGVSVAHWGLRLLMSAAPIDLPRLSEVQLDARVLAFALGLSLITGLVFGLLPALRLARAQPQEALKSGSRSATESGGAMRLRGVLVALEVGLSAVLLITAGLLINSFARLMRVDKGFDVDRVLAVNVVLPAARYTDAARRAVFFDRLLQKTAALPGVVSTGLVSALPLRGETWVDLYGAENDPRPLFQRPSANVRFMSPSYFKTLRVPLESGRMFEERDRDRRVVIISRNIAARLFPGQNPVGRRMLHNEMPVEVVGVAPDIRSTSLDKDPVPMLYIPYWQRARLLAWLMVRTANEPRSISGALRAAIRELDGEVPVPEMWTLDEVMAESVGQRRFQMALILAFGTAALALASFGIYGVLAYSVARRRAEMGIRMALGAGAGNLQRMVLRQGMTPALVGLAAGVAGALVAGHVLRSLLFEVSERDPLTIAGVALVLAAVSAAACAIPARRAARVDPMTALRFE